MVSHVKMHLTLLFNINLKYVCETSPQSIFKFRFHIQGVSNRKEEEMQIFRFSKGNIRREPDVYVRLSLLFILINRMHRVLYRDHMDHTTGTICGTDFDSHTIINNCVGLEI